MNHEKLLATIHEDKVTISRVVTQNKQLKEQLTELQDKFIKIVLISCCLFSKTNKTLKPLFFFLVK